MLTVKDLTISYHGSVVLEKLNLSLQPGCIHGLVGMNGSGKTTLFHGIYGLLKPDAGEVLWEYRPVSRKDMALLETQHYFYPGITGREYLGLFPSPHGAFKVALWEELFRLPLDELIENYSTGMKTKLALTGVIKLDKPVMLLDEPFNGTDLETGRIIKLLLAKLKEKSKTVIVTSHVLETLTGSCDYIHHLADKGIRKTYHRESWAGMEQDLFAVMEGRVRLQIDEAL